MPEYQGSALEAEIARQTGSAAPEGLSQTQQRAEAAGGPSAYQQDLAAQGYMPLSGQWYTGQNVDGTNNGWSTPFVQAADAGWNKALADGTAATYFSDPNSKATGVVTWDHTSEDGTKSYTWGDVFVRGEKVGNLYDDYDTDNANLMMSVWALNRDQKVDAFSDSNVSSALQGQLNQVRGERTQYFQESKGALAFQKETDETEQRFTEGNVDEAVVGGAAVGGAVTGAGVGAGLGLAGGPAAPITVPGGALIGGIVGGISGLIGGWLNKDYLTEQAARAYELTELARETEGVHAGAFTGLQNWSQFAKDLTNPFTNITHGLVELTGENEVGDGLDAYHAVDDKGEATRPVWAKPLGLAGMVVDGAMSFMSPLNRGVYTAEMGGVIAGETGMLVTTGTQFDPRKGQFENVFLDDEGNFDPVSGAAGILNIGIDAVQLGTMRSLSRMTRANSAAIAAGGRPVEAAGYRYILDDAGNVVSRSKTFTLLAPSEQVAAASVNRNARLLARSEGRAVTTVDDFYRVATSMATGTGRLKQALINGFGEGYEELAQGVLEPISQDGKVWNPGALADSFFAGAAGGLGMSLGATYGGASAERQLEAQAFFLETMRRDGAMPSEQEWRELWDGSTPTQRRVMAARSQSDVAMTAQALTRVAQEHTASLMVREPDTARLLDARKTRIEKELANSVNTTDAYRVITGQLTPNERVSEGVDASAATVAQMFEDRLEGLFLQRDTLKNRIEDLEANRVVGLDSILPATIDEARAMLADLEIVIAFGERYNEELVSAIEALYRTDPADVQSAVALVDALNAELFAYFDRTQQIDALDDFKGLSQADLRNAAAMYVTHLHSREPKLDSGSYVALLPQVAWDMTRDRANHTLRVNTDILDAIAGDFDGDKMRSEYQLILPRERFLQARAGSNFAGRTDRIDITVHTYDEVLVGMIGAKLTGGLDPMEVEAEAVITSIDTILGARYGSMMSMDAWTAIMAKFRTAVKAGSKNARQDLLSDLAREAGQPIDALGRKDLRNEWLWASKIVRLQMNKFQHALNQVRAAQFRASTPGPVTRDIETPEGVNAIKARAVNTAQTLALFLDGNTLFRKIQKIHFTFYNSSALSAEGAERPDWFYIAELYEELARNVTQSELDRVGLGNSTEAKVLAILNRVVDSALEDPNLRGKFDPRTGAAVLANLKVKDVWWENGQPVSNNEDVSLVQLILKRVLEQERQEADLSWETNLDLQAKHNRLRPMTFPNENTDSVNAERAFFEVFKGMQAIDVVGNVTGPLAPHTTLEQWMLNYLANDKDGREDIERLHTNVPEYLDRKGTTNIPYTLAEMGTRSISNYRSVMDAMLAVGRGELRFNPDVPADQTRRAFAGRMAEESHRAYDSLVAIHTELKKVTSAIRTSRQRENEPRMTNAELVQEAFTLYPELGHDVLALIDDATALRGYSPADGGRIQSWIYDAFAMEDADKALMHLHLHSHLGQIQTTVMKAREDDRNGTRYNNLTSRFQQLVYRLSLEPAKFRLEELLLQMESAGSVHELYYWINTQPGFLEREPPLLPYKDDVADFDPNAGGAWGAVRSNAQMRTAITRAAATASRVSKVAANAAATREQNLRYYDAIETALNSPSTATSQQKEALRKFLKALQFSMEMPKMLAPQAMLTATTGAQDGVDAHTHDKGKTRDSLVPLGEAQSLFDAFGFAPNLERTMESQGSHSVESLRQNLTDLARTRGEAMDANGRIIEWEPLTPEYALRLLKDPRTEALGFALLIPNALEDVTGGRLVDRLLYEPSMENVLNGKHYERLYDDSESEALDKALKGIALVDAKLRAMGEHFSLLRYVDSLVIVRTSSLTHTLTDAREKERAVAQAYIDTWKWVRTLGLIEATPSLRDGGALNALREVGLAHLRAHHASADPGSMASQDDIDNLIAMALDRYSEDEQIELDEIVTVYGATSDAAVLRSQAVRAKFAAAREHMERLTSSSTFVVPTAQFRITGDPAADAAARQHLMSFARTTANFPARAPEAAELWRALLVAKVDGSDLSPTFDWDLLSRAVTHIVMVDSLINVAGDVSIPPLAGPDKDGKPSKFLKYFDPEFLWALHDLTAPGSMVGTAAAWLHVQAEQPIGTIDTTVLTKTMLATVLNPDSLGVYTPGLQSQLVDHSGAIDSAGVGPGAGASGNGPKRWAALEAALDRKGSRPPRPADALTSLELTGSYWNVDTDVYLEVELPSITGVAPTLDVNGAPIPSTMPLALLDNRYFGSIQVNGVDILNKPNVGFSWAGEGRSQSIYKYVAFERLQAAVREEAKAQGVLPKDAVVTMTFIHPDSRPEGPADSNSVYFDGMSHMLLPDGAESLPATLWSDNGGMVGTFLQRMLDAGKSAMIAVRPFTPPNAGAAVAADNHWLASYDLAAMLRAKTKIVMEYDDGSGPLELSDYNSVYKMIASHHIVVGRDKLTGEPMAWKAEQFIAWRAKHGTDFSVPEFPMNDMKLVKLSPDVLRTMVGEFGDQGVPRYFQQEFLVNADLLPPYVEITPLMLERFGEGWLSEPGTLADSTLVNVGRQTALPVRRLATPKQMAERVSRAQFLGRQQANVATARYTKFDAKDRKARWEQVLEIALGLILPETNTFEFLPMGVPIAPKNTFEVEAALRLLSSKDALIDRDYENTQARGWTLTDTGAPSWPGGILTFESLNDERAQEHQLVVGDIVVVELETFARPGRSWEQMVERATEAVRIVAETGATIILGPGPANTELRWEVERALETFRYEGIANTRHLFEPVDFSAKTQNERAYESTTTETYRITANKNSILFYTDEPVGITEGNMVPNPSSPRLRSRRLLNDILPSSRYPNYNVPVEDDRDSGLYTRTLAQLRTMLDPANTEARAHLLKMGGPDLRGAKDVTGGQNAMSLEVALNRFHTKISTRNAIGLLGGDVLQVGDIIPYVRSDGQIILHRHGFKDPEPADLNTLQDIGDMRIALAKQERDDLATARSATVVEDEPRPGYGKTLLLEIEQQLYGAKMEVSGGGLKHTLVHASAFLEKFLPVKLFNNPENGREVDGISDRQSALAKEAVTGWVNNYRDALAFYQWDFTDDLVAFFFGEDRVGEAGLDIIAHTFLTQLSRAPQLQLPSTNAKLLIEFQSAIAGMLTDIASINGEKIPPEWVDRLAHGSTSPSSQIARAVIFYVLTPGADVDNVIRSAGFSHPDGESDVVQTRFVPGVFADLLDHGPYSALHKELISRFQSQLAPNITLGLDWDWTITVDGATLKTGVAYGELHSANTNPTTDEQAHNPDGKSTVSWHNALAAFSSFGARSAHKRMKGSRADATPMSDEDFLQMNDAGALWQTLISLPDRTAESFQARMIETRAESARRELARDEIVGLFQRLNIEGEDFTPKKVAEYNNSAVKILSRLNLRAEQIGLVDTWVRMELGKPHGIDPNTGAERGVISADDVLEALAVIKDRVDQYHYPTAGAAIPLMPENHVSIIYAANRNLLDGAWSPKSTNELDGARANSWDGWIDVAFGTAWITNAETEVVDFEPLFQPMFLLAVDGLMHGYQNATSSTRDLPVTADRLRLRQLMDPMTDRMLVSISADENLIATDPALYAANLAGIEEIVGGPRIYSEGRHGPDPSSARGYARAMQDFWSEENVSHQPRAKTVRNVRKQGQNFIGNSSRTSAMWRNLMNLRVGLVMFNFALIVAAPFEALQRQIVNRFANIASGESTGRSGKMQARFYDRIQDTSFEAIGELFALQPKYTQAQLARIDTLVDAISTYPQFEAMIYDELLYHYPMAPGTRKLGKTLESFAKTGARLQDPSYGMLQKSLARAYVEAVLLPQGYGLAGGNVYSVETAIAGLARNIEWAKNNDNEAHRQGLARIANLRSMKPNVISLTINGMISPASQSKNRLINSSGNMIKIMAAFQTFWANASVQMTGMQGPADFAAFWLDGRKKTKLIRRMQSFLRGESFIPEEGEVYDMSEAIEGMDLADSFIRGGVTHTMLFQFGLMAGGLGLGGEDDEEKWRRRQSELQGVPFVYDPLALQNDIRNQDALFLDWLPFGLDQYFLTDPDDPNSRSMVQMNWTLRYFLSPILGMEKFFQTGNFSDIIGGFQDALGAHPVINTQLWNQATDTAAELHNMSVEATENGRPEEGGQLLITSVSVLERMLMENAMINAIYIGSDTYDRDPYKQIAIDSDGNPQMDVRENPYGTETVSPFRNEDGEVQQGYVPRDSTGAKVRSLTENRFGLALVASLWDGITGGDFNGDYWRQNMAVKIREVQLLPPEQETLEADILAAFMGAGGQANLTEGESAQRIKRAYEKAGVRWEAGEVEKLAAVDAAKSGYAAASVLEEGREKLTDAGARYIFEGLLSGSVTLGDAGLNGVFMTRETRDKVRDAFIKDLMHEGVELGLTKDQATWRMRRIMFGTGTEQGTPTLAELIYTDQLPWTDTLEYNQLNTTYVMGPNGLPMATGFTRDGFWGAMGVKIVKTQIAPTGGTGRDQLNNTTDQVAGINTGMRGLELRPVSWEIPSIEDVVKDAERAIVDAIKDLDLSPNTQKTPGTYSGGGYGSYGGGGGGSYFSRMYALPRGFIPYGNSIPFINTSNPIIRRATVRRERVWSERGRLKQWQ